MKKKLIVSGIVACLMFASAGVGAYAATKLTLIVNGSVSSVDPKIINGTTYVPIRAAANLLGAKVYYDAKTHTVTIATDESTAPKSVFSAGDFLFTQLEVEERELSWGISVDVTNKGSKAYSASFSAAFYDAGGKRVGIAKGGVNDLVKNGTKTANLFTKDDLDGWKIVKFQIDSKK